MFSHVTLGANDLARAKAFYDQVLPPIGWPMRYDESAHGLYGYAPAKDSVPQFWITRPLDRKAATSGNGVTVAFNVMERQMVDSFHAAALKAGDADEGAPGLRPHYHPDYYGAYVRDPDGNKICCVCHLPE
jgi:catechol 2,3-dioxygenase-like lactoylglutathione lyase family enzyme